MEYTITYTDETKLKFKPQPTSSKGLHCPQLGRTIFKNWLPTAWHRAGDHYCTTIVGTQETTHEDIQAICMVVQDQFTAQIDGLLELEHKLYLLQESKHE